MTPKEWNEHPIEDESAYLEECRTRRRLLSRYRVAASNAAGILSAGVLGLELAQKLGFRNLCSNGIVFRFENCALLCFADE